MNAKTYPLTLSKEIQIKRRKGIYVKRGDGDNQDRHKYFISSSRKGTSILVGLTQQEEKKYLPIIIGISPDDPKFGITARNYWNNIRKFIPPEGLTLEVGMIYETEEEHKNNSGTPINIEDYVLYRYCLVYSRIANSEKEQHNSPKIRAYITDRYSEANKNYEIATIVDKAVENRLALYSDPVKQDAVLFVYGYSPLSMSKEEKVIALQTLSTYNSETDPEANKLVVFNNRVNDKLLQDKAFITQAINAQLLRRIPNTDTIMYKEHTQIGTTTDNAIDYLTATEQGRRVKMEIEVQLSQINKNFLSNTAITKVLEPPLENGVPVKTSQLSDIIGARTENNNVGKSSGLDDLDNDDDSVLTASQNLKRASK